MPENIQLNGTWTVDWLSDMPYTGEMEPRVSSHSPSATPCPVPGYWEDLTDLFRTTALHTKLKWNPLYTLQRYPQAGYVPDMALPNPVGCFVYEKTFAIDDLPASGESALWFGGVQNTLSAWLNGHFLGCHKGYSAPFSFGIPQKFYVEGENRITLALSNHRLAGYADRPVSGLTSRAANECTGGIYGDVELRFYPDGLRDIWVSTEKDCAAFTVHIEGDTRFPKTVRIYDGKALLCEREIPAGADSCRIDTDGYTLWSPETPKQYIAVAETGGQRLSQSFGIRRLTVDGTMLRLNGNPFYFRGTCEHCYQPMTVHPTRDGRYYRMVIRKLRELGFNAIRFHTWVPPVEYMDAADALGMALEIETPNNTAFAEWHEIVRFCRRHASVNVFSTGNELQIDAAYEEHLRACADLVHRETDALFSPMSAMRGIEYNFTADDVCTETPFRYNPQRLAAVGAYCDLYNSYSNALTSYSSAKGTQSALDTRNAVYGKPLLSHEICIHGTYIDLSLMDRYAGSRIGDTELFSSVRRHLAEKGLLNRANLYYRNSAAWQQILRKHCFETVRRCTTFSGYDFLGDIDTHWHTFGYCVGMMNEFYELKPGETVENVRRYNSDTVLLNDLPAWVNYEAGARVEIPLLVSHYGKKLSGARLSVRISGGGSVLLRREIRCGEIPCGAVTKLCILPFRMPKCEKPMTLTLHVTLSGGVTDCENAWEMHVFPKNRAPSAKELAEDHVDVLTACDGTALLQKLREGRRVVLFGTGPFASAEVSWQIALAGRTNGHLATVVADHPLLADFPHRGYCGSAFAPMLTDSHSVVLDIPAVAQDWILKQDPGILYDPIIDIAGSYKNARREAMLVEYRVGMGKLLICTLRLPEDDPGALWLKNQILRYAAGEQFMPVQSLTEAEFAALCTVSPVVEERNTNEAMNKNDITMR